MTWQILSRGFILNQSQPLIGYSPFQRQMERIWILPNCEINKNSFVCHCPNYGDQPSAIILLSSLFLPTKLAPFHFYHSFAYSHPPVYWAINQDTSKAHMQLCIYEKPFLSLVSVYLHSKTQNLLEISTLTAVVASSSIAAASTFSVGSWRS